MNIIWDKEKNDWLLVNRNISFEEISEKIINKEYLDITENPAKENQQCFVIKIKEYIWIIPFIIDLESSIVLKTAFPSRKYNKRYGGKE